MARKRRRSKRQKALQGLSPGEVQILGVKARTKKADIGRQRVGFSAQFVAATPWSVVVDSRSLVRLLQVRLGEHYQDALANQFDPNTGRPLPRPMSSKKDKDGNLRPVKRQNRTNKLGIRTGEMLNSWQIGKVGGKFSSARGIVQPFMAGGDAKSRYQRRFFIEYFLGLRTYYLKSGKPIRDARGRFAKTAKRGNGPKYEHAPIDFQAVDGLAAIIIRETLDEYINDSGLKTSGPLLPPPDFLGPGKLSRVRDASGF
jgi:hypothetical protein